MRNGWATILAPPQAGQSSRKHRFNIVFICWKSFSTALSDSNAARQQSGSAPIKMAQNHKTIIEFMASLECGGLA
ncbi:MAG TPA: hypothetical protein VFY60_02440, partial [Pyrinomonadaceae bacterium]|nr:hypothetical protein [Pyrinomonadaceae bacterium]